MPRADLLALTLDDLTALTNRGTLKRAQREVEANECQVELIEDAEGSVTAKWSDGVECRLPADVVLRDAHCSCAAAGLCRHLVRTVLAYQAQASDCADQKAASVEPWDPGTFSDDDLAKCFRPAALSKARTQFKQGLLVELVRGAEAERALPSPEPVCCGSWSPAICATRTATAPSRPRAAMCRWPSGRSAGSIQSAPPASSPLPPPRRRRRLHCSTILRAALLAFTEYGISGAPRTWIDQLTRLENACREGDLVWPAEILGELIEQQERYAGHDARFAPDRVAELVGELLIRCDAIRHDTGALPQLLIRGARSDRAMMLGAAHFVGLGCGVRMGRRSVELTAYLQDSDSGSVVAVSRDFADSDDPAQPPKPFADLAQTSAVKRTSFAALGSGQLLIRGGKRTPSFHLLPSRAEVSVQPQTFAWESLRPPVLVEDFAELDARLTLCRRHRCGRGVWRRTFTSSPSPPSKMRASTALRRRCKRC